MIEKQTVRENVLKYLTQVNLGTDFIISICFHVSIKNYKIHYTKGDQKMGKDFIISTTNLIEGQEVDKYLGVISDRIVVGAGLFSEVFAGFTDAFGGRSSKFEARMQELYNYLMRSLETQAKRIKADAIIGLSVDIDEISGKSYQMFMVSGLGTAVRFKKPGDLYAQALNDEEDVVVTERQIKMRLFNLSSQSEFNEISVLLRDQNKEDYWRIVEEKISKLIDEAYIIGYKDDAFYRALLNAIFIGFSDKELINSFIRYSELCYPDEFSERIFDIAKETLSEGGKDFYEVWKSLINNLDYKFDSVYSFMSEIDDSLYLNYAFPLLRKQMPTYSSEDIRYIESIVNELVLIQTKEPRVETRRVGIKKEEVWICSNCSTTNSLKESICWNCKYTKIGHNWKYREELNGTIAYLQMIMEIGKCNVGA